MRYVKLVHLLLHVIEIAISDLRRVFAIVGVEHFRSGAGAGNRSVNLKAEELVKALRTRGELPKIIVVERAGFDVVEKFAVGWIEYDMDCIGLGSVGKRLSGENDGIARVAHLRPFFLAGLGLVPDLSIYEAAGVLQESRFQVGYVRAGILCSEGTADIAERAYPDAFRQRSS
jgi:hypothetical protein